MHFLFIWQTYNYNMLTIETFAPEEGEIKYDAIFSGWNTFHKIIRNQQNQQQLISNRNLLQQSAQRVGPPVSQRGRPTTTSHVWIILCGLFHNMGGIGCCLPRNVYVAPQSSGEMLIWCETELINWFALVNAAGIIRPKSLSNK